MAAGPSAIAPETSQPWEGVDGQGSDEAALEPQHYEGLELGDAEEGGGGRAAMTHREAKTLQESQGSQKGWRHRARRSPDGLQGPTQLQT